MINHQKSLLVASCLFVLGGCGSSPYPTSSHDRYPDRSHREARASGERSARGELGRLADELDGRASRASQIVEGRSTEFGRGESELYDRIHRFSDRARQFHGQLDNGELAGGRLRGALQHLRDEAHETDRSLRRTQVSREMLGEWQEIGRVLDRMLTLVEG